MANGSGGNFGSADSFPGIGSPVGSILPGIVLATTTTPASLISLPITVPVTYSVAPSYLPDAPFASRIYGESSFTNMVFGGKIRFTGPNNALGVGIIPFYRYWFDKGDDNSGLTSCSVVLVQVETLGILGLLVSSMDD